MKYTKTFEAYLLNEANEAIKAQGAAKNALFIAQKDIERLYSKLKEIEYIKSYKLKVETYNSGYMLKTNELAGTQIKDKNLANLLWSVTSSSNIYMQPDTFFDNNFEDGQARIEYSTLDIDKNLDKYHNVVVKSKKDIVKIQKDFNKTIKEQVNFVLDKIDAAAFSIAKNYKNKYAK